MCVWRMVGRAGRDGARAGWTEGGSHWEDESGGSDDTGVPAGDVRPHTCGGKSGGKTELWLWHFPTSPGRQQEHEMPSRTQLHRRHLAVPLQRQHRRIERPEAGADALFDAPF